MHACTHVKSRSNVEVCWINWQMNIYFCWQDDGLGHWRPRFYSCFSALFHCNICLFLCGLSTDRDRDTVITVCKCALINSVGTGTLFRFTTLYFYWRKELLLLTKEGICLYAVTETNIAEKLRNFPKVFATLLKKCFFHLKRLK